MSKSRLRLTAAAWRGSCVCAQYRHCLQTFRRCGGMTCTQILQSSRTARALAVNIEILDASVYEIPPSNAVRGLRACKRIILGYSWLALNLSSYCDSKKLYKLRPKLMVWRIHSSVPPVPVEGLRERHLLGELRGQT